MRRRRWKHVFGASLIGLVLCDLALSAWIGDEGLLLDHPLPPFGAITHPRQREWIARSRAEAPGSALGVFDRELGWSVAPSHVSADGRVSTNSIAARGRREYARPKPDGVLRLVCVGDSYTWCDEVEDQASFEAQLEAGDARVEAVNLGVAAYGTDQALLRLRREGLRLQPDVVVVGLLLENIGRNVNRYRPLWYPGSGAAPAKPRFVLRDGALELVPQPFAERAELLAAIEDGSVLARCAEHEHWRADPGLGPWRVSSIARCAAAWFADREREVEGLWRAPDGEPFQVTLALLESALRESRAAGAREALVLIFPRESDLPAPEALPYWTALHAELDRRGLAWIDVSGDLARAAEPVYAGGHLNRAGNALVAARLRAVLEQRGLWPTAR